MDNTIKLTAPITLSGDDVERALAEQAREVPSVSRAYGGLRGTAQRAADELNRVLDIDVFELFARAWTTVPRVRNAVQFSALRLGTVKVSELTSAPPAVVKLDEHTITSTSYPVLTIDGPQDPLPELRLTLEIVAHVPSAALTFHDGRIELMALGNASMRAQVKYKDLVLKEHATGVRGASRVPFNDQPAAPGASAGVDFQV